MASDDEIILGIHSVAEALAAGEAVRRVVIATHRKDDREVADVIAGAKRRGIEISIEEERWFGRFQHARHQHVAAVLAPFEYSDWKATREKVRGLEESLVLVLDHIEDPHNLGALIRDAECAGAQAVVIPERRGAGITGAVRRASAGAVSHVPIVRLANIVRALEDLKADGFWVYGLAIRPEAVPYVQVDYRGKCALVVGSEGKGLARLAAERCDRLVRIPVLGQVESLNASAAAAVVLYEAVRQKNASQA
jgi:23S rRNA (guanosine2251-2'-O)-methyltransferase